MHELGLTYEPIWLNLSKQENRLPSHTQYNPNGRVPTIIDHYNNDFVLWFVAFCFLISLVIDTTNAIQGVQCNHIVLGREVRQGAEADCR